MINLKKLLAVITGVAAIIALSYFLIAGLAVTKAETQLAALKNSWEKEKICHESCAARRAAAEQAVIKSLAAGDQSAANRLKKYFSDARISAEFKGELVKIASRAYGPDKPPAYLRDYLANPVGDSNVKAAIIISFAASSLDKDFSAAAPLNYYFNILSDSEDEVVKQAAIDVLSNYKNKAKDFSASQLAVIKNLVLDRATNRHLRQSLVLLLSDYYPLFPEATASILKMVYEAGAGGANTGEAGTNGANQLNDEVSRAFSADILNRFSADQGEAQKFPIPPVSQAAWDEYYNN